MNAVTRVVSTAGAYAPRKQVSVEAGKQNVVVFIVAMALFLSAFTMVYVKDLNRRLFIQSQNMQQMQNQATLQWSNLLLEKSTWASQSRIQRLAKQKLNMVVPNPSRVVLVNIN